MSYHKAVSFVKSAIRLLSSVITVVHVSSVNFEYLNLETLAGGVIVLAVGYGLAEIVGVIEEFKED